MRNGDQAAEGRAGSSDGVRDNQHHETREEESTVWENPSIQKELANLIITDRVRRASRHHRTPRR